jgi:hypothetical protein
VLQAANCIVESCVTISRQTQPLRQGAKTFSVSFTGSINKETTETMEQFDFGCSFGATFNG